MIKITIKDIMIAFFIFSPLLFFVNIKNIFIYVIIDLIKLGRENMSVIEFDFFADVSKKNKLGFNDALPIGNGHIGAMVYGDPISEKLVLNENTVWIGKKNRKRYNKDYYKNYKAVQNLLLNNKYKEAEELAKLGLMPNPKGEAIYSTAGLLKLNYSIRSYSNYKRILDMNKGLVAVEYDCDDNHIKAEYIASYLDDCLYIKIEAKSPIEVIASIDREKLIDFNSIIDNTILLSVDFNKNDRLCIAASVNAANIKKIGANLIACGNKIEIYVSMATTLYVKNPFKYVMKNNASAMNKNVYANAVKDYQALYNRQSFECDNLKLKQMYDFSRYLMISSSRNNLPANIQGIWNQDIFPSWDSKYTININLQMNYWNVFSSNLFECSKPLFKLLKRMHKNGKRVAKELYHVDGFVAHHNTDIYGDCYLQDHYLPATVWPLGAAWLSLFIYEAYEYTMDVNILKEYSYILIDAAKFILNILIEDNKELILCPSLSPENTFYVNDDKIHVSKGCEMDSQIIRDLFEAVINVSKAYRVDKALVNKIEAALLNLPKTKAANDNTIKEWNHDYPEADLGHRHISHLYGLFPSDQINSDEFKRYAYNTIEKRLKNGGGHIGWSKAWITCMYTRLGMGDFALKSFNEFIENSTSRVGLDLHPPFQIDGNFGIGKAILEMFVHSTMNKIEILPALPSSINNAKINGVIIKGGYMLDLEVENNKLKMLKIISKFEGDIAIIYNNKEYHMDLVIGDNFFTLD